MYLVAYRSRVFRRCSSAIFPFLAAAIFLSCTPTTGSRIFGQYDPAKIKAIAVTVKNEEDFSVRLSREEMTATGAVLFGLLGAGIEAAARHSADRGVEEQFKAIMATYDPKKPMNDSLHRHLRSSGSLVTVVGDIGDNAVSRLKQLDGVLEVTLKEWGLRRCPGPSPDRAQIGLNIYARMSLAQEWSTVWERDELHLDGECRPWQDYRSHEGLLKEALSRTLNNLAGKIVNEILFP